MLQPVRTKFRKAFKGRIHGKATRAAVLNYGAFGLKALQPERIIGKQIEAARVALTRHMKRHKEEFGQEFFQIFRFQKNQQKLEWEKGKVILNITPVELSLAELFLRLTE